MQLQMRLSINLDIIGNGTLLALNDNWNNLARMGAFDIQFVLCLIINIFYILICTDKVAKLLCHASHAVVLRDWRFLQDTAYYT